MISGGSDNQAIIWDLDNLRLQHRLVGHTDIIHAVAFTPDGARAVTGSNDTTLRLWNVSDGKMIAEMRGHKGKIWNAIGIRQSDGMIASGDHEGEIRLWDGRTGAFVKTLAQHDNSVGHVSFTKDGRYLVAGAGYQARRGSYSVRVWEVATGKETVTYSRHGDLVLTAATTPNGQLVATGGGGKYEIELWDPKTGNNTRSLIGTGAMGWSVGFSSDGRRIAWGSTYNEKSTNERGPLEYQLQLPGANQSLGRPERISEDAGKSFLRARWSQGAYALGTRRGGNFGFDALLDIKKDGKTVATIERGAADGYDHRSYGFSPDGKTIISGGVERLLSRLRFGRQEDRQFHRPRGRGVGHRHLARRPLPGLGRRRPDHPPVEPEDARADREPVPRPRRRVGDVDPAGLLHGLAGVGQDRRLADQQGRGECGRLCGC